MSMDIQQLKQLKILLIGDSCTDVYNYGTCERISPEAPVPILKTTRVEEKPGMAKNVMQNLLGFGHNVKIITNFEEIRKERFVDQKTMQHLLRVDLGENQKLQSFGVNHILDFETKNRDFDYDCVVISDYDKGFISGDYCSNMLKWISKKNTMVFVDSKKTDLSCYENCIIKVNELEYSKVTKGPIKSQMIVTLGSRGAKWMEDPERIYEPKEQVDVFDVCGAGDTFMSALVTAYMSTFSMPESINFANRCAGISVKNFGNYTVSLEDIK